MPLNAPLAPQGLECYNAARMGGLVTVAMQVDPQPLSAQGPGEIRPGEQGRGCLMK